MKANELRINNILEEGIVVDISERYVITDHKGMLETMLNPNEFHPIPLTKEWLIRFGFIPTGDGGSIGISFISYYYNDFVVNYSTYNYNDNTTENKIEYGTINIKYVHQLQNLYFALTGEELTYTIP